jgi:subtilisin family serine protease
MSVSRFYILRCLTAALVLSFVGATAHAQTGANVAEIRQAIDRDGRAAVIVEMMMPDQESARGLERQESAADIPVETKIERNRAAVASAAREMKSELAEAGVSMEREFENLPMFITTVDVATFERLLRVSGLKDVYLDKPLERREVTAAPAWPMPSIVLEKVAVRSETKTSTSPEAQAAQEQSARRAAVGADSPEKSLLSSTVTYINADKAWARGFTGRGQSIAVLDDGIDRNHDMFIGKVVAEACYSTTLRSDDVALCPNGANSSTAVGAASNCSAGTNVCSHGSHVAGIAAGNDTIGTTTLRGVAYEAGLIPIQVFTLVNNQSDCDNKAPCLLAYSSATLNGLNFLISVAAQQKLAAVNMSLGGNPQSTACNTDVRKSAIDTLRGLGVLTAIAAGNDGLVGQITPPSCISTAIAVSSTIITVPDSGVNHSSLVDVLAPGVLVRSAGLNNSYVTRSGTSMATPHAAGAIAILKSSRPNATATEIETALKSGGVAASLSTWTWTTPRLDINKSLDLLGAAGGVFGVAVPGVFGSRNPGGQSYLRFFNVDSLARTVTVQIFDDIAGTQVATWSREIRGFASPQVNMATIEAQATPRITPTVNSSQFYTLYVDAPFVGYAQHVLYSPQTSLLSNVSGCDNGLADSGRYINNVHTTLIPGFPSFVLIHNTGSVDARPSFDVQDSRDGTSLGTFTTATAIRPRSSALIQASDVLQTLGRTPDNTQFHINLILNTTTFTGFAQHWVQNTALGTVTSMGGKCDI